jgi:hypothetical protein
VDGEVTAHDTVLAGPPERTILFEDDISGDDVLV